MAFLESLTEPELRFLPYVFDLWALPHQRVPEGDWRTWVILGGRGAGKTRAGAEWVRHEVEGPTPLARGRSGRLALVGETFDQVRDVMVFGESGILACSPPDRHPVWEATKRRLVWPNGATAQAFSASEPENLRGPQFDAAWADELGKWSRIEDTWDMLQFALRIGAHPRQVVTTTPRNQPILRDLLEEAGTVVTHATTRDNQANLAESFLAYVEGRYGGSSLGRQEIEGEMVDGAEQALWDMAAIDRGRLDARPPLGRVVVAVDPPVTGHAGSDDCGIVVVGANTEGPLGDWRAVVIADESVSAAKPHVWAKAAVEAMARHDADLMVAEVNQGGDLVEATVRQFAQFVPYKRVHASVSKVSRAGPVAALYEQGRVAHLRHLGALERQMSLMTTRGYQGKGSPDRVDALVWALTELMIEPARRPMNPRVRTAG
ncbi:DNA-packaging protein [Maritimibacter sp. DP1N21-5]|uniref:DNA-packaging protein n=1 Tax=Maritimibacter sp. DP1N21-5 TaxID=2836867 RepID=UPI001C449C4F|nr:terminase family protein [Maritimibacter sp. DP1N21-5]MBV7410175.1 terminase family protein [Maritimibacter sp. DP1N21-5]